MKKMASKVIALVLVFGAIALCEQRVLIVEVPPPEHPVVAPGSGPAPAAGLPDPDSEFGGGMGPVSISVYRSDVEPVARFLYVHYRNYLLRQVKLRHVEGNNETYGDGDNQCDPDECYSHCYLQGFRSGKCKENKCFCTQSPASTTTTPRPV